MSKPIKPVGVGSEFTWLGELWHVRGFVDDLAVCRYWMRRKQRWHYEVFNLAFMEVTLR